MSISKLLFGEIALKKKLVTKEQVEECLEIQRKLKEMGITKTLGAVMHDKKFLSMVEIKEILREMTGTKDWNAIEGYEILGKLGKGGMGSVYKARHQKLDRLVALKVLPPELAGDQEYLDRFLREARAAAKLNHPNIVQALDVGDSYGYQYFAMEYVEGKTVKEMIEDEGCLPEGKAIDIVMQVAEALIHAWKNGMVHRDIKPSNIIVTPEGVTKLCDLGLAKHVSDDSTITQTGVIMGTPFYLSPEQARCEDLDCRSDIYSLGVTFFHMLTGQVPFTGNSAATILYKHIFLEPPKPKSLNPKISSAASNLCVRMLAKKPEDRPENPQVLLDELRAVRRQTEQRDGLAVEVEGPAPRPAALPVEEIKTSAMPEIESGAIRAGERALAQTRPERRDDEGERTAAESGPVGKAARRATRAARPPRTLAARALLLASVAGLAGLAALVVTGAAPEELPPSESGDRAIFAAALNGALPREDIVQAIQRATNLEKMRLFGQAARELDLVAPAARDSTPDEIALRVARDALVAAASTEFSDLYAKRAELAKSSGASPKEIVEAIDAMDLPTVVRSLDAERTRIRKALGNRPETRVP